MSLVSELSNPRSGLAKWCARTLPGTGAVVDEVVEYVGQWRPVRPHAVAATREHWSEVGGAWGQRLADLVQAAPPYGALVGLVRLGWADIEWAHDQAGRYPTHRDLSEDLRVRAVDLRPIVSGWVDLDVGVEGHRTAPAAVAEAWADLLEYGRSLLEERAPTGTLAASDVEAELARVAWLVGTAEQAYRDGFVHPRVRAELGKSGRRSRSLMRALAPLEQVQELGALASQLVRGGAFADMRALAGDPEPGQPLGIASPTLVPRWADADLLLGRVDGDRARVDGTTLVDVKTVLSLRDRERLARWVWQILCYRLLDTADMYAIANVGILFGRHGVLVGWSVDELVERLTHGRLDVEALGAEFRPVAGCAIRSSGWTPRVG